MPPTLLGFWGHQPCPPSVPFGDEIGKMIAFRSLQALEVSRGEILGCCLYWKGLGGHGVGSEVLVWGLQDGKPQG